jgi:glycerol-3-phosphate acyltransferase PlsY
MRPDALPIAPALILLGYLCGSVPFGVLVAWRLRGVDVRKGGSGNIGATNVARLAGRSLGLVVLLLDALKGVLPVLLARALLPGEPAAHAWVGLAAVLGHVFPVWLRLRGGKGVATTLGVALVLAPLAALAGAAVYVTLLLAFRLSSLGSLLGGLTAVGVTWATAHSREAALLVSALFALVLWTHRGNIRRLVSRSERRL